MGELLMRRREMVPQSMESPLYEITSDVTGDYNTGVLLFDTPKSFTIYCEATFNNYNWAGNNITDFKAIFGINGNCGFFVGRVFGKDYRNNEIFSSSTGRYTALVMNKTTATVTLPSGCSMTALHARENVKTKKKIAVTYDHTTRTVTGFSDNPGATPPVSTRWYRLDSDLITNLPLRLNFRGADSTVNRLAIYDRAMSGDEIQSKFWN